MEIKILDEGKNSLEFEVKGEDHTLCNALREELRGNSHVKIASYNIAHPLVGIPKMFVETDGSESPRQAISKAVKKIAGNIETLKKAVSKELK